MEGLDQPPTIDEVKKTISATNSNRASGKDSIPAKIFKATGHNALEAFHDVLQSIWSKEDMPEDFRNAALIVALCKNKGIKSDCGNYRGIILSVAGKIFARILLNRLITVSERSLPEAQCGFSPGCSTVDMIFSCHQTGAGEVSIEQNKALYAVFIDLTKAFDTVNSEAHWTVLERYGCPKKFVRLIRLLHDGMTGQVLCSGDQSAACAITNGVLAPVLFNRFFTCMLAHAVQDMEESVYIRYRLDGSLLDLRRLNAKTKCLYQLIQEALFADDCALLAQIQGQRPADDAQQILGGVEGLRSDHQPQQDRGTAPACSKHHTRGAKHQHR